MTWTATGAGARAHGPEIRWGPSDTWAFVSAVARRWLTERAPDPFDPRVAIVHDESVPGAYGLLPCGRSDPNGLALTPRGIAGRWLSAHVAPSAHLPLVLNDRLGIAVFRVPVEKVKK